MRARAVTSLLLVALVLPVLLVASGGELRGIVDELRHVMGGALVAYAGGGSGPVAFQGNVNGMTEQPLIEQLDACRTLEEAARQDLVNFDDNQRADGPQADVARTRIESAAACVRAVSESVGGATGFQPTSDPDLARRRLAAALKKDTKAGTQLAAHRKVRAIRKSIDKALDAKSLAKLALQGIRASARDAATYTLPGLSFDSYFVSFQGRAERRLEAKLGWRANFTDLKARVRREPGTDNRYLAFRARGRNAVGSGFFDLNREVWTPFEGRFTVGAFAPSAQGDQYPANAIGCLEADVSGSSPLRFLAACGRYVVSPLGYQAFTSASDGKTEQLFLPGVTRATIRLQVEFTRISAWVKPADAADTQLTRFGTWDVSPGNDTWRIGVGVNNLTGPAEIGVDDLSLRPLPTGATTTTTTLPSGVTCSGTFTPTPGFSNEADFGFSCTTLTAKTFTGFALKAPSGYQFTNWINPIGFTCNIQSQTNPNDWLWCGGSFGLGDNVAGGRIQTSPGRVPTTSVDLTVRSGTVDYGPFRMTGP